MPPKHDTTSLVGRRVLVVGATGGIGGAVVESLGAGGAELVVAGRNDDELRRRCEQWAADGLVIAASVVVDYADASHVDHRLGGLDVDAVVMAAGVGATGRTLDEAGPGEIEQMIAANTVGPLLVIRALLPGLSDKPFADVVLIGSTAAQYPSASALYGARKRRHT